MDNVSGGGGGQYDQGPVQANACGARWARVWTVVMSAQPLPTGRAEVGCASPPTQGVSAMERGGREAPIGFLLI